MAKSMDPGNSEDLELKNQSATLVLRVAGNIKRSNVCNAVAAE